ncbi:flagellar biosynthesis protein FlhF [Silvimonas iriomotensis]|uniref:Flagellar biosynthesis protein FlhF n=1 Tax=Silvimonas iriomotensis TaxID=449662 RepID=A0ABQ2PCI4_9NEIS|nr:flagellar biosynthesis protein FlhF [Silvimonas iriomotensis]GGP23248.1 flagellar biosynthesis regulator FlhF [Silvimonas iriomotensis]
MVVKKFYGATTRDALRQVRDELGPDALILSNRQVAGGGVEIMAVADSDVASLTGVPSPSSSRTPSRANGARLMRNIHTDNNSPATRALERSYAIPDEEHEDDDSEPSLADINPPAPAYDPPAPAPGYTSLLDEPMPRQSATAQPAPQPAPPALPSMGLKQTAPAPRREEPLHTATHFRYEDDLGQPQKQPSANKEVMEDIAREIRLLRGLMESQIAGMAWGELSRHKPEKLEVLRQLLAGGFSPALSRQLVEKMPDLALDAGMRWIKAALVHNLPSSAGDLIERGGTYALIGPTGVGKTTTVAKLAARCALLHGPDSVALLTTDSYRIGAQDQLRIYGRIIGIPVHDVKDQTDLELTLADLSDRHLVLIDTVGMGQRDQRITEQLALFGRDRVQTILLLAANAAPATLDDVARRYKNPTLAGCILTKLDEAMSQGGCLDVAIRHRLALQFVTNGQRVPEDLHHANVDYLIDRAFRTAAGDNPVYQLRKDEYPLYMGSQNSASDVPLDLSVRDRRG